MRSKGLARAVSKLRREESFHRRENPTKTKDRWSVDYNTKCYSKHSDKPQVMWSIEEWGYKLCWNVVHMSDHLTLISLPYKISHCPEALPWCPPLWRCHKVQICMTLALPCSARPLEPVLLPLSKKPKQYIYNKNTVNMQCKDDVERDF
jgi:hypothetical protein